MRLIIAVLMVLCASPALAAPVESFESFLRNFEAKAVEAGVSRQFYRQATAGLTPDPNVPEQVVAQPEFTTPVWDYLDQRVTAKRIEQGIAAVDAKRSLFEAVGRQYGVDPYLLASIWGIETSYGAVLDNKTYIRPIIRSLATLVHQRRSRIEGDTADFIAALLIAQKLGGDPASLVGSWAGAIGHLQVNPTNVLQYGTDGDGDGRVDLQNSLADALATSAKYLLGLGYRPGVDWGFEVEVPDDFDYLLATREQYRPISFFAERGVTRVRGKQFQNPRQEVFLYVPAGKDGPKFLMTPNYLVIKGYNFSDSYALAVAHLTDRLTGGGAIEVDWPRDTQFPNLDQRKAIQRELIRRGLLEGEIDGRLGPITQAAYAKFQAARGEVADGFITFQSYQDLVTDLR